MMRILADSGSGSTTGVKWALPEPDGEEEHEDDSDPDEGGEEEEEEDVLPEPDGE